MVRYAVPQEMLHYQVSFGYAAGMANDQEHGTPQFAAYHGEIAIDPETGSILRITLETELKPPYEDFRHAVAVEYGSVTIGDRAYICPVESVALSRITTSKTVRRLPEAPNTIIRTADETGSKSAVGTWLLTYLNDVSFTDYHVFRSETRILP